MKTVKLLGRLLLALAGCGVLIYLSAIVINWRDQPPSAEWLRLHKVIDDRPVVADADNSYVYMLGFAAPANDEPIAIGARRRDRIEKTVAGHFDKDADPLKDPIDIRNSISKELRHMKEVCGDTDRKRCAQEFDAIARDWHSSPDDSLLMARYEKLLTLTHWREVVTVDVSLPLPPLADVLHAQRLEHLHLRQFADAGNTVEIKRFLGAEFLFWRATLRTTNALINRMIAVAALRNHFFFANQTLRRLPPDRMMSAVPDEWSQEFTAQDRSMLNVMAGELFFIEGVNRVYAAGDDRLVFGLDEEDPWTHRFGGRLVSKLARPLFKIQDQNNHLAKSFLNFAEDFDVPTIRYVPADAAFRNREGRGRPINLYNLTGDLLSRIAPSSNYIEYAYRGAGVEGMRRAALLITQLRSRGVPGDHMAEEVSRAELRDPFTDKSFEWDAADEAVIFEGPEKHRWHRQVFFY